jgi:VWFA-related protein
MEGLYFIAAGLVGFAVLIILLAWTRWTEKTQSAERVELLRTLAGESGVPEFASETELELGEPIGLDLYETPVAELAAAPGSVLDLRSPNSSPVRVAEPARREPGRVDPAAAPLAPAPVARVAVAPPAEPGPARAPQFVVTVPDAATRGGSQQMTFGFKRRNAGVALIAALLLWIPGAEAQQSKGQGFSFRTGVELINVTTTVTDSQGRFVSGLKAEDFEVYEDGKLQTISQFDSDRVPVSLGIALDTSGSMAGEKIAAAQSAVNRFLYDLLGDQDEVFLYRFDSRVDLVSGWTDDRRAVGRMLGSIRPNGGTALYDAVAESVPLAQKGTRRKKALLVISDGNDQNSSTSVEAVRQQIRESEVLVYAIGIDASGASASSYSSGSSGAGGSGSSTLGQTGTPPINPQPSAFPGARKIPPPSAPSRPSTPPPTAYGRRGSEGRLNVDALRALTDDSGGRTEIILSPRDLDPATAGIASELSRQYFLGYSTSSPKDGRWHTIEVRLKRGNYTIRARKGFIGS